MGALCSLHARLPAVRDEHKITATVVFKNPDPLFTAINVPTNMVFMQLPGLAHHQQRVSFLKQTIG